MWAGIDHVTPNDTINTRTRHLCGAAYVDHVAADARGRLWFTYKYPGRAAGVGYADKKLRVHLFSVPAAERSFGVAVFEGPGGSIWLQGSNGFRHNSLIYLYRVDRVPASKTVCQGVRG
jgi:streptogramin lyase